MASLVKQSREAAALVIGSADDPHASAVVSQLDEWDVTTLVVDAVSLAASDFIVEPCSAWIKRAGGDGRLMVRTGARGWLRRIAPADWQHEVISGSREAAIGAAWLALLGGMLRTATVEWLTHLDRAFAAENKLVQYRRALELSITVPATIVASDVDDVIAALGDRFILKPLGPGQFFEEGVTKALFAREVSANDSALLDLGGAPFIAQHAVKADRHLRVVTVGKRAWVCALEANGLDVDWRSSRIGHEGFRFVSEPGVAEKAVQLANALNVGYSSQDWVVGEDKCYFLDLNPGGQWLFLPDPAGSEVTEAIASWLAGRE